MSDGTQSTNDAPRRDFETCDQTEPLHADDTAYERCRVYLNSSPLRSITPSISLGAIGAVVLIVGGVSAMMRVSEPQLSDTSADEMRSQTLVHEDRRNVASDYADVVQDARTVKSQLDQERAARLAAEEKALLYSSEAEALKRARALAEATAAQDRARLEAEQVGRRVPEQSEPLSDTALATPLEPSTAGTWNAQISVAAVAATAVPQPLPTKPVTIAVSSEQPTRPTETKAVAPQKIEVAAKANDNGHAELLAGQKHFVTGNISAARQAFERAAQLGRPEGALAVGNTFDPVSLAKLGLQSSGDPARARLWYRRAYEIALNQQQKPAQQKP